MSTFTEHHTWFHAAPTAEALRSCGTTASAKQVRTCNPPVIERECRKNRAASTCPGRVRSADAEYHTPPLQGSKVEKLPFSHSAAASRTNFEPIHAQRTPGEPLVGPPPLLIGAAGGGQLDCVLPGGGLPNKRIRVFFASHPPPSCANGCAVRMYGLVYRLRLVLPLAYPLFHRFQERTLHAAGVLQ